MHTSCYGCVLMDASSFFLEMNDCKKVNACKEMLAKTVSSIKESLPCGRILSGMELFAWCCLRGIEKPCEHFCLYKS